VGDGGWRVAAGRWLGDNESTGGTEDSQVATGWTKDERSDAGSVAAVRLIAEGDNAAWSDVWQRLVVRHSEVKV